MKIGKTCKIIAVAILTLIIIFISYFVMIYFRNTKFAILKKEIKGEEIVLYPHENATVDDLTITHKGGGHKILIEGGDESYAVLDLKIKGRKTTEELSTLMISSSEKKFWKGYLIGVKEMGWNGEPVALLIDRFQEENLEFGKEIFLQKYRVVKNKDLKISFADLQEFETTEDSAPNVRIKTGDFYVALEIENSSGKTGVVNFSSDNPGTEKWEGYGINFISFDLASESIKIVVSK